MAGTKGREAFSAYLYASRCENALPWEEQDQKAWERAAASVKLAEVEAGELRMDAAHERG